MPLLSSIPFGSYLSYTNTTESDQAQRSRTVMRAVKNYNKLEDPPIPATKKIVGDMNDELQTLPFAGYFGEETLLVAVPGHGRSSERTFWLTYRITQEMEEEGLGKASNCLKRAERIRKSSGQRDSQKRPKAEEHVETLECASTLTNPGKIVLVDDVVTSGTTLLACASVLRENFPDAEIFGFALIRYENQVDKFSGVRDPVIGTITLRHNGRTTRAP